MLSSLLLLLACFGLLLHLLYRKRRDDFNVFSKLGVRGPTPHWFFGNYLIMKGKEYHQILQQWTKDYGKVYGYYEGPTPILVVSDIDIIRNVYVKQFPNFHARKPMALGPDPCGRKDVNMFLACGTRWKRLRTITNPTFCTRNLCRMAPAMNSQVDKMLAQLQSHFPATEGAFDMLEYYQSLTLNMLLDSGFGLHSSTSNPNGHTDSSLYRACKKIFDALQRESFLQHFSVCVPELRSYLRWLTRPIVLLFMWQMSVLQDRLNDLVKKRRQNPAENQDLLQLMLDAEASTEEIKDANIWQSTPDKTNNYHYVTNDISSHETRNDAHAFSCRSMTKSVLQHSPSLKYCSTRKLTDGEIEKQAIMFILAGYDTTSTALSFVTYLLATHPDKQRLLVNEIDNNFPCDEKPTAESVKQLPYLDGVIKETLRLYAPATGVTNRECVRECDVGAGLTLTPGVVVQVDVWSVHRDPELWGPTNPDHFEPDRFLTPRDPLAYLPFGAGPRNCIGRRFALLQAKLTLVRLLQVFRFETCAATQRPLRLRSSGPLAIQSRDGVTIRLMRR